MGGSIFLIVVYSRPWEFQCCNMRSEVRYYLLSDRSIKFDPGGFASIQPGQHDDTTVLLRRSFSHMS